ncbi:MAG: hypothetical protein KDK41_04535 [Leptospiraceae bacterium]|nr:hypothetical protein [Leptospiraceae bacterium]
MKYSVIGLIAILMSVANCISSGIARPTSLTTVELSENNFSIVETGVSGEATMGVLLGFALPMGASATTLGVAQITGERDLQKAALDNLWKNFEAKNGAAKENSYSLINITNDITAANWFGFYATQTVTVRADVIEFYDE